MADADKKLLPCPFCGGAAEVERPGTMRASMIVACTNCGCRVESSDVVGLTLNQNLAWNRRAPPASEGAQNAEGQARELAEARETIEGLREDVVNAQFIGRFHDALATSYAQQITHWLKKHDELKKQLAERAAVPDGYVLVRRITVESAARKLALVGKIYDGDKESRSLASELDAMLATAPPPPAVPQDGVRVEKRTGIIFPHRSEGGDK